MITRHMRGKTVWVDLESPTEEELALVMREFDIDERVHEEIATPTPYPLTIPFPGYVYLILHFPVAGSEDGTRSQEVDFIIGKQFLIPFFKLVGYVFEENQSKNDMLIFSSVHV